MIRFERGDLLAAQAEALVNTVNTVGVMGKGLALRFKELFPENYEFYKAQCEKGEVKIGKVLVYEVSGRLYPRYIINFPTKQHWRGRSRLEYIQRGLQDLVQVVRERGIRSIAIPPLGCGNGGLDWNEVRTLIEQAFQPLADEVEVIIYAETTAPPKPEHAAYLHALDTYLQMAWVATEPELEQVAQLVCLHAPAQRRRLRPKALMKEALKQGYLKDSQLAQGKQNRVYAIRSEAVLQMAQESLAKHPEWQRSLETLQGLLEGADCLMALEEAVRAATLYRAHAENPERKPYFKAAWEALQQSGVANSRKG